MGSFGKLREFRGQTPHSARTTPPQNPAVSGIGGLSPKLRFFGRILTAKLSIPLVIAGTLVTLLPVPAIQQSQLRAHVSWLSDASLAGRRSGQAGAVRTAQYIFDQFKAAGFDVRMQEFSNNRRNVVARYGSVDRHVVIGAHYDGQSGFPSASDNAAGVAVMLELARDLRALRLPVSLVFIAFDDEEQGLNGSFFYADNPIFPLEQTSAAIIFDTMGRSFIDLKATTLFVLGSEYSPELSRIVQKRTRDGMLVAGVDLIGPRSDFAAFARRRIPFLFFSHATHKDYHGAGDRPELLNYPKLTQDSRLIGDIIVDTARLPAKPVYLETPVYPAKEVDTLVKIMNAVKVEKPDLPAAYRMVFDDMLVRVRTDRSRSTLNVAASAMLGLATPQLSSFLLEFVVAPAYEKAGKPEIARAVTEEARRPRR